MKYLVGLMIVAVAFAGCTGGDEHGHEYTCSEDGTVVDTSNADHHNETFDPETLCPYFMPFELKILGIPTSVSAYQEFLATWRVEADLDAGVHAMRTGLNLAMEKKELTTADDHNSYGEEVAVREHQNAPFGHEETLSITVPGTYYLRAYAFISGEYHWTEEKEITVQQVNPTGTRITATQAPGDFIGGFTISASNGTLGDALVLQNDDVQEHTFTFDATPEGIAIDPIVVGAQSSSEAIVLPAPGNYRITVSALNGSPSVELLIS